MPTKQSPYRKMFKSKVALPINSVSNNANCITSKSTSNKSQKRKNRLKYFKPQVINAVNDPVSVANRFESIVCNLNMEQQKDSSLKPTLGSPKKTNKMSKKVDIWDFSSLYLNKLFRLHDETRANFTYALWNARSVREKDITIKSYMLDNDLDFFDITESWLFPDELPYIHDIKPHVSYTINQRPRPNKTSAKGGSLISISKGNVNLKKVPTIQTKVTEIMEQNLCSNDKEITIVTIYRPPNEGREYPMSHFWDDLEEILSYYSTTANLILEGDFNIPMNNLNDYRAKKLLNIIEAAGLVQHVKEPTHKDGNIIDLVISRDDGIIKSVKVDSLMSDHKSIIIELNLTKPPKLKKKIKYRKIKEINLDMLKNEVIGNIDTLNDATSLEDLVDKFNEVMGNAFNKEAPLIAKTVTIRPPTPWTYDDIKHDKAMRRKLERTWRRTGLQIDYDNYIEFRNKFNTKLKLLRAKHYANLIEENKGDPRNLFRVINFVLHRNTETPFPPHTSDKELADEFNQFFTDKIDLLRNRMEDLPQVDDDNINVESIFSGDILTEFSPLTSEEIAKIIQNSQNKFCDLDPIPVALLKECLPIIIDHITEIVNLSLQLGDVPKSLKQAIIKPLLKKAGLDLEKKNYRPVSNLSFLSKLIERIVAVQLTEHFMQNELFDKFQSAYRKCHSTETALLRVQNDIIMDIDGKKVVMLVLLDLSAAFDTIDHEILLNRLSSYFGIKGTALKWFESYLSDRIQSVAINNDISSPIGLKYGVPQGSVLGPLLFTAYMAPLKEVLEKHGLRYHCYADDTQLYIAFQTNDEDDENNEENTIKILEGAIPDIKKFMIKNKLKLNDAKTEFLLIGTNGRLSQAKNNNIQVGDAQVYAANEARNLGVIFDQEMTLESHVKNVCKNAYYHIKNLSRIRKFLDMRNSNIAAHAFVTSKLDYGNALFAGAPNYIIHKLQMVQNAAARVVTKTRKFDHITYKLAELHWLPVEHRIKYKINLITWKALNNLAPLYISDLLSVADRKITLRSETNNLLNVPKTSLKLGEKAFSYAAPKLWNKLPKSMRDIVTLENFKKHLKTYYFKEAFNDII